MVVSEECPFHWCPERSLYLVCSLIDAYKHCLKRFSLPASTKKVVNFYGSRIVTWLNNRSKTMKTRAHRAFSFIL